MCWSPRREQREAALGARSPGHSLVLTLLGSELGLAQRGSEQEGCTPPEPWLCLVPFRVPNVSPGQVLLSAFAVCPSLQDFCGHRFLQSEAIAGTETGFPLGQTRHPNTDTPAGNAATWGQRAEYGLTPFCQRVREGRGSRDDVPVAAWAQHCTVCGGQRHEGKARPPRQAPSASSWGP